MGFLIGDGVGVGSGAGSAHNDDVSAGAGVADLSHFIGEDVLYACVEVGGGGSELVVSCCLYTVVGESSRGGSNCDCIDIVVMVVG